MFFFYTTYLIVTTENRFELMISSHALGLVTGIRTVNVAGARLG